MTGLLASVTSVDEAATVMDVADIIDLKNPIQGALGALPLGVVEGIARFVDGRKPVSATVGDLPMSPDILRDAVVAMAQTGVDIVKVGFFGHDGHAECARALAHVTGHCKIVAVLFADQKPNVSLLGTLAEAGFHGAMLDTADKSAGGLCNWLDEDVLRLFVAEAKSRNLLTGLAGSLRLADIPWLAAIGPDYLGFRGALCRDHVRHADLDFRQASAVARTLCEYNSSSAPLVV
jgi:uncharacterized protein (UPF0264 family)